ncbi:NHL repeat-containing protein [Virgibacillus pantothenticus]|uniref:NHL repeat-containing protein n=1 Tax=Virgibacillus pantothenticus TaxID=1473 RepID=UPI0009862322|nr:NHL repeat-containing protein [Virgibacillus pantothenticus]
MSIFYWEIQQEIGMIRNSEEPRSLLVFPIVVQHINSANIFICDPKNQLAQSFIINKEGKIIWKQPDILHEGQFLNFSYVKMISENTFLGIEEKINKVIEFNNTGKVIWAYALNSDSSPISADRHLNGNTVIIDFNRQRVIEVSPSKEIVWEFRPDPEENILLEPCLVQALPNGNILVVDEELHTVFEISKEKKIEWRYGIPGDPGESIGKITYPQFAFRDSNDNTYISDSQNHRILKINKKQGLIDAFENGWDNYMRNNLLFWPTWIDELPNGNIIVADSKNSRIIEINNNGEIVWQYGNTNLTKRLLSFPRSVQVLANNNLLITDTHHNRIVEIDLNGKVINKFSGEEDYKLFWPRYTERLEGGKTLIADGRNGRILIFSDTNKIIREISQYIHNGEKIKLLDPHFATKLENGNILIVDSPTNTVVEVDAEDHAVWLYGPNSDVVTSHLNDPHKAVRIEDSTYIADSANNRILHVNKQNLIINEIDKLNYNGKSYKLEWPRCLNVLSNGNLFLLDGGSGNGFEIDKHGKTINVYKGKDESTKLAMKKARFISIKSSNLEVYLSDNLNSRILKIRQSISN